MGVKRIVTGSGVPQHMCGTYLLAIQSVNVADSITVAFEVVPSHEGDDNKFIGRQVRKVFKSKVNKFFQKFLQSLTLDSGHPDEAVGQMIWVAVGINAQEDESFLWKFMPYTDMSRRPAIMGDPRLSEAGVPSGMFYVTD